ncbi:MAG: hypothetical protein HXX13_09775 [Bacteroidetes bacterium]|nr:hypothetical protein [Bacteroidota bacterium]
MKTAIFGTIVLISLITKTQAQYWIPCGGRASAMSNAAVAIADAFSVNNNQAGMVMIKQPTAALFFENPYFLKELSTQSFGINLPTAFGVFGSVVNYCGNSNYNTIKAGLAYARMFGNSFSAGLQLDLLNTHLAESYGSKISGTIEAGIQIKVNNKLSFGAHVFNPVQVHLAKYMNERIPTIMRVGWVYIYSQALLLAMEVKKNTGLPPEFLSGIEYKFFGKGFARLGVATSPFRYSFGTGFLFHHFSLDISSSYHESLGFSPQASIAYAFGK